MTNLFDRTLILLISILILSIKVDAFLYTQLLSNRKIVNYASKAAILEEWLGITNGKAIEGKIYLAPPKDREPEVINAYSKQNISENDILVLVPLSAALDSSVIPSEISRSVDVDSLQTRTVGLLALILLYEKSLGKTSKYYPYIQSLPTTPPGILSWTKSDLDELQQSSSREFRRLLSAIEKDIRYLQTCKLSFLPEKVEESFRWAVGIVKSRRLRVNEKWYLVPGMDSITFDPFADNEPYLSSEGIFRRKNIAVKADRSYRTNQPVYMSYGLKSAAQCLEDHGILPVADNLSDLSVEITLEITEDDAFVNDKLAILEELDLPATTTFDLYGDVTIDPELLRFLRLKLISGKDSFILEPCLRNTINTAISLPFSRNNEQEVMNYLLQFCQYQLEKMNKVDNPADLQPSRESSSSVGSNGQSSPRVLLARLRLQERKVLEANIRYFQSELDSLQEPNDQREYYQEKRLKSLDLLRPLDPNEIRDSE